MSSHSFDSRQSSDSDSEDGQSSVLVSEDGQEAVSVSESESDGSDSHSDIDHPIIDLLEAIYFEGYDSPDVAFFKEQLGTDAVIIESLREEFRRSQNLNPPSPDVPRYPCIQVKDLPPSSVAEKIDTIMGDIYDTYLSTATVELPVPDRSNSNQFYDEELNRNVLKVKGSLSLPNPKICTIIRILTLIRHLCTKNVRIMMRDIYYMNTRLFIDQSRSDAILDDVACMVGCTRSSLMISAMEKGLVIGCLSFSNNGVPIDCNLGGFARHIPSLTDEVSDMKSDAIFILLIEKHTSFMRLVWDRFYDRFPCIIITGRGMPDVATRSFLRKLKMELNLPVLALMDGDPEGLGILSVYMYGSKKMSYDSLNLVTPDIKWLGIRSSDLENCHIFDKSLLKMTSRDLNRGKNLLGEEFMKKNGAWASELSTMITTEKKVEIQALSSLGIQFLTDVYLPYKLQEKDWC